MLIKIVKLKKKASIKKDQDNKETPVSDKKDN